MEFWESARVYGVIRPYSNLPKPYSTQIYLGTDQGNTNLNKYKRAYNTSKMTQEVSLYFDDLKDNTKYQIFITVASNLPYIDPP